MKAATLLAVCLFISSTCWSQQSKIVTPETTDDLKQICKSYQLLSLESELKKDVAWPEVWAGSSCLNFVMGVFHAVVSLDVGYYPDVKFELADPQKKLPFKDMVAAVMKYIDEHPELLKEPPAPVIVAGLMEARIIIPKHWEEKKTP